MNLKTTSFDQLSPAEIYKILQLREKVFVLEQTCLYKDIDDIDYKAWHSFFEVENNVVCYARVFEKDKDNSIVQIGRVVTDINYRHKGLATEILKESIRIAKEIFSAKAIYLEAQVYAIPLYASLGFEIISDEFLEDGIPHVKMLQKV